MVLKPPYQYVIDTSALIDLNDQYPPKIFPGVWDRFDGMCEQLSIIAPREVLREIKKGNDYLIDWSDNFESMFLEPCEEEVLILQDVLQSYDEKTIRKNSTGPWADPLVISCGKHFGLTIIQQEKQDGNSNRIPRIARLHNVESLTLIQFFEEESWTFS